MACESGLVQLYHLIRVVNWRRNITRFGSVPGVWPWVEWNVILVVEQTLRVWMLTFVHVCVFLDHFLTVLLDTSHRLMLGWCGRWNAAVSNDTVADGECLWDETDWRTCPTGARHVLVVLDESYTCRSDTRRDLHVSCLAGVAVMLTCVKVNGPMLCSVEATVDILWSFTPVSIRSLLSSINHTHQHQTTVIRHWWLLSCM